MDSKMTDLFERWMAAHCATERERFTLSLLEREEHTALAALEIAKAALDTNASAREREMACNPVTYIEAIKSLRERTGLPIKEAKHIIDEFRKQGAE